MHSVASTAEAVSFSRSVGCTKKYPAPKPDRKSNCGCKASGYL